MTDEYATDAGRLINATTGKTAEKSKLPTHTHQFIHRERKNKH
jgi:hypothetical protein